MANQARAQPDNSDAPIVTFGPGGFAGWFLLQVRKLQAPVVRFGKKQIFRVFLHGDGFTLPIADGKAAVGFYATRFVAAESESVAKSCAIARVLKEWRGLSLMSNLTGTRSPRISVENVLPIEQRFCLRPGLGFTFYLDEE